MGHVLKNCRIFNGEKFLEGINSIKITDGRIEIIKNEISSENFIDCKGKLTVPGYVDIHTHGIAGFDNSDISESDYMLMEKAYYSKGTTTFIPTFPTISSEKAVRTMNVYKKHKKAVYCIHLEGPFINKEKKGAQNPEYILVPEINEFINFIGHNEDMTGRVTLSPEMDKDFKLTDYLLAKGIVVSFGHTECDYDTAKEFFKKTDSIATHMFNAMPALHHRKPGITLAALMNEGTLCEIIPDMIHLHPEIIRLIFKLKGPEKIICISDSIIAAGLEEGKYTFAGLDINVKDGSARLESGNLAGSIITMADGVCNLVAMGIPSEYALMSATSVPAKAMGIEDKTGYIREGSQADILILKEDYSVEKVIKNGSLII